MPFTNDFTIDSDTVTDQSHLYVCNSSSTTQGSDSNVWQGAVAVSGTGNYYIAYHISSDLLRVEPHAQTAYSIHYQQEFLRRWVEERAQMVSDGAPRDIYAWSVLNRETPGEPAPPPPPPEPSPAQIKARELLDSVLSDEQRRSLHENKHFEVVGKSGRRYRIQHGSVRNVYLLDETGKTVERFCAHHPLDVPAGTIGQDYPTEDHMVTQKLMLECEEEAFLAVANRIPMAA